MQPIDEIRSERLTLSRIRSLDVENLTSLYSDSEVMATLGGSWTAGQTEVEIEKLLQHWAQHGFGPWMARESISTRLVGITGLLQIVLEEIAEVHVGYVLAREFWGQGLATEMARASAHAGLSILNLPSLISFTLPTNLASRRVMEKVGFSFERNFTDKKGVPQVLYRLTRATWRESAGA
jgi:RimJ/RimL family protein N-acetyltransferase